MRSEGEQPPYPSPLTIFLAVRRSPFAVRLHSRRLPQLHPIPFRVVEPGEVAVHGFLAFGEGDAEFAELFGEGVEVVDVPGDLDLTSVVCQGVLGLMDREGEPAEVAPPLMGVGFAGEEEAQVPKSTIPPMPTTFCRSICDLRERKKRA